MGQGRKRRKQKRKKNRPKPDGPTRAQVADVHRLYEEAVQDPKGDVQLVRRFYRGYFGREPMSVREDFCGTAAFACAWVRGRPLSRAYGVDLDPGTLKWAHENNVSALRADEAERVTLIQGDVLEVEHEKVDVTVAFNFSYFVFQTRELLLRYLRKARSTLAEEGLLVLDLYGGADANRTLAETREHDDFDYVWDQDVFDPIHHHAVNHIHFEFPDGSRIEKAFSYDWRLWTIPEIRDVLADAGFSKTEAWWEQTDHATNEGNGVYYKAERAADDPAWVAYVTAVR